MASAFDRRRANAPEDASEPVYNLRVATLESSGPVWGVDENNIVHNPSAAPAELLQLKNVALDHNDLSADRIVLSRPIVRTDGRVDLDPRPLCMFNAHQTYRLALSQMPAAARFSKPVGQRSQLQCVYLLTATDPARCADAKCLEKLNLVCCFN